MKLSIDLNRDTKILVFCTDFNAYHLKTIRAGIQDYFEGSHEGMAYLHLDITELYSLFGDSIKDRLYVIGMLRSPDACKYFQKAKIPCLNLQEGVQDTALGFKVGIEGEGREAARYFIREMNLENLGFIGGDKIANHDRRMDEFVKEARKYPKVRIDLCQLPMQPQQLPFYALSSDEVLSNETRRLKDYSLKNFLQKTRKPVGLFCANDRMALNLYYISELLGFSVPDEVAILGITGRPETREEWCNAVSAVQLDHHALGYAAASAMHVYACQGKIPGSIRLEANGISHSQTTTRRHVNDYLIRRAMVIIQDNPEISVGELATQLKVTRRVLDARFQRSSNITTARAIEIERFSIAKGLLREKSYNLESIAALAGYPNSRVMRNSFYRFTRMGPQQFRELGSS